MNPYLLVNLKQKYLLAAPNNFYSTKDLMCKLTHRLQVICALEAAKMALPVWEKYASNNKELSIEQIEAPKKTIETIEKWLDGKATIKEVKKDSANNADAPGQRLGTIGARAARVAAAHAAYAAYEAEAEVDLYVASSVVYAANAHAADVANSVSVATARLQFYNGWWARCYPLIQKDLQDLSYKYISGEL